MENDRVSVERVEELVQQLGAAPPEQAVADLTRVANRAVIELHKIARQEANARRGGDEWGRWARLANAVRSGVLQIAAVRDSVKGLTTDDKGASD